MLCNAAFESGGIKGLAYIGVLSFLEEKGIKVYSASGSSVGALFASLVLSGYTSMELIKEVEELDQDILVKKNPLIVAIKNIGLNSIENLENKLSLMLKKKGYEKFIDLKKADKYLLKISVTDYNNKRGLNLPDDYKKEGLNPDEQKIAKTVAMSCSVPLFYSLYKKNGNIYGDGGIVNKFPINLLERDKPILAFKISKDSRLIQCFKGYTDDELRKMNIHIIRINTLDIHSLNYKKGYNLRMELYKNGYLAVKEYYEKYLK